MSEGLQARAAAASRASASHLQRASEAGTTFVAMADSLLEAACALPATIARLSRVLREGSRGLPDALAVLQEVVTVVKASKHILHSPSDFLQPDEIHL